jgi:hypothetical protein
MTNSLLPFAFVSIKLLLFYHNKSPFIGIRLFVFLFDKTHLPGRDAQCQIDVTTWRKLCATGAPWI